MDEGALLTAEEEVALSRLVGGGTPEEKQRARDRLVWANQGLVSSYARRLLGRGVPLEDLVQEGNIGLLVAIRKFDSERGCRFSTYAGWWIRHFQGRAVSRQGQAVRLSSTLQAEQRGLFQVLRILEQQLGRDPVARETAEAMGSEPERVTWLLGLLELPASLDESADERGREDGDLGGTLLDTVSQSPEDEVQELWVRDEVLAALGELDERHRLTLELRFGLESGRSCSLREIGNVFDVSVQRAQQMVQEGLEMLRGAPRLRELREEGAEGDAHTERVMPPVVGCSVAAGSGTEAE